MAFARWQAHITDAAGNVIDQPTIEVRREISGAPLARLYSDFDGNTPLSNPFVPMTGSGGFAFFHAVGGFYKIRASYGAFSREWRYVAIGLAGALDVPPLTFDNAPWSEAVEYAQGVVLRHSGASYASKIDNTGVEPGADENWQDYWFLLAVDGSSGTDGVDGTDGEDGLIVSVNGQSDPDILLDAEDIDVENTPSNYSPTDSSIEGHLAGIDAALTSGAAPAGYDELVTSVSLLALMVADNANKAVFPSPNRVADSFESLTYVDVAGASNLDTSTSGTLKPSASSSAISGGTGSNIGNMTSGGGLAAAFNGVTSTAYASCAQGGGSGSGYVGKNYSASPKVIHSVVATPSSDQGFDSTSGAQTITLTLYGKNGSAPSSATNGTSLGSWSGTDAAGTARTINSNDTGTAWDYVWLHVQSTQGAAGQNVAEVVFYSATTANVTVASTSFTAASAPGTVRGLLLVREVEAGVAGTDYSLEFSRDGGTSWTTATLTELFTMPSPEADTIVVQSNDVNVSGQPSGTSLRWRFKTLTTKMIELRAAHVYWS